MSSLEPTGIENGEHTFKYPNIAITDKYRLTDEFLFDPKRVSVSFQAANSTALLVSGSHAFVLSYQKKGGSIQPICMLGVEIGHGRLVIRQLQGVMSSKSKEFFHSMDIVRFFKDYSLNFSLDNGLELSTSLDLNGIESTTESARLRLAKFLQ